MWNPFRAAKKHISINRYFQLKRGDESQMQDYIGPAGEVTVNTTDWSLHVQDGVTPGGHKAVYLSADRYGNLAINPEKQEPIRLAIYKIG